MGRKRNKNKQPHGNGNAQLNLGLQSELFTCDVSPIYGRFLKTKANVKKGDVVLVEKYLVAGPRLTSRPVCIGCHSEFNSDSKTFSCSTCKWSLCSPKCGTSPFHTECAFLQEHKIEPPDLVPGPGPKKPNTVTVYYGCITVLRCLLLKFRDSGLGWQKLMNLESHNSERVELPNVWKETQDCVTTIRDVWKLAQFTEDEIVKVCGLLTVNSFEMGDCFPFGGIFPTASMCAHDCVPNCSQSELIDEISLEIRAMVDLPEGSPITLCYDSCLKGTQIRRQQLQKSKYFDCNCARCADPTELGTHFSTLLCVKCRKGFVIRDSANQDWKCGKCSTIIPGDTVNQLIQKFTSLSCTKQDIKAQEEFLVDCKPIFHPNHFIPFGTKFSLCMAYGREEGFQIEEMSNVAGHRKLELCQDVMRVLNVLTPGLSISRGNILYEQQAAEVLIAKNLVQIGKCSKPLIKQKLKNSIRLLEESIQIFDLNYATKMLAESAKNITLAELKNWMSTI